MTVSVYMCVCLSANKCLKLHVFDYTAILTIVQIFFQNLKQLKQSIHETMHETMAQIP